MAPRVEQGKIFNYSTGQCGGQAFLPPNMSASDYALQYKVNFDAEHDGSSPSPYAILVCQ